MRRFIIGTALVLALGTGHAWAQAEPMSSGMPGTPITPQQIGNWNFTPGLSRDEAVADARDEGYTGVTGLHEDAYGDWLGQSGRGGFIVFPDGRAYPL